MTEIGYGSRAAYGTGTSVFRGWAGVVVEVAPNRYVIYEMVEAHGEIQIDREVDTIYDGPDPLARVTGPPIVDIHLQGVASSRLTNDRQPGPWLTARPAVES